MQLIYHGSIVKVESPKIIVQEKTKDFGPAFYCTSIQEQAVRWATKGGKGYVNCYRFNDLLAGKTLKIKMFNSSNLEWLNFIAYCRSGKKHDYDLVIGPMADDQVYNWVTLYMNSEIDADTFFNVCRFKYPTNQIAFCTKKSLSSDYLQFLNARSVRR